LSTCLIVGLRYYPVLASVYLNSIFTLTYATFYAWLDFLLTIVNQGMCDTSYYNRESQFFKDTFNYFGTDSTLVAIEMCIDIPLYLCVKLSAIVINKIYCRVKSKKLSTDEEIRMKSNRDERVLLRLSHLDSSEIFFVVILLVVLYRN